MSAVDRLLGWQRSFILYADGGQPVADVGDAYLTGSASIAAGLDDEVMRLYDGDVRLVNAGDFTGGSAFTLLALVRVPAGRGLRRIVGRVNGGTEVSLSVNNAGQVAGVLASARGNYRTTLTGSSNVADGRWHVVAIKGGAGFFGSMNLDLVVDDKVERTGSINPGIFGTSPNYTNVAPIIAGRAGDTTNNLNGEVAAVLGVDENWTLATFATLAADMQGRGAGGFVGWGIAVR